MRNDEIDDTRREYSRLQSDPEYQERIRIGMEILNRGKSKAAQPPNVPPPPLRKLKKKPKPPNPVSPRISCFPELTESKPEPKPEPVWNVIGANLKKYIEDAQMTRDQLAAQAVGGDTKALREHISGRRKMRPRQEQDYETVLSKRCGRKVSLRNYTPPS
jgi:hypothetical protein